MSQQIKILTALVASAALNTILLYILIRPAEKNYYFEYETLQKEKRALEFRDSILMEEVDRLNHKVFTLQDSIDSNKVTTVIKNNYVRKITKDTVLDRMVDSVLNF